jgi:hypothetical protein
VAERKTLIKIIFSAVAASILLASVYILLDRSVRDLSGLLVNRQEVDRDGPLMQDLIGRAVEFEKTSLTESLALHFTRQMLSEQEKVDFFFESARPSEFIGSSGEKTRTGLIGFAESNPYIERITIINYRSQILFSTSDSDAIGESLDSDVYGAIFVESGVGGSRTVADEAAQSIVLYRYIGTDHALLVHFGDRFLNGVLAGIPGFEFEEALITGEKVILVNFPNLGLSESENVATLVGTIRERENGFLRVKREDLDKTVYFLPASQTYSDWIFGLTFETAGMRISFIGALILVVQSLVVAAIIIFILATVRDRRQVAAARIPIKNLSTGSELSAAPRIEPLVEDARDGGTRRESATAAQLPEVTSPVREGMIPLAEVEEVVDLNDVGEAEVADEYEEEEQSLRVVETEVQRAEETIHSLASPVSDGAPTPRDVDVEEENFIERQGPDESAESPVESPNDLESGSEEVGELDELEKLEAVQREIMGPEAQMLHEMEKLEGMVEQGESDSVMDVDADIEDSIINDMADIERRTDEKEEFLPNLESLVQADGVGQGGVEDGSAAPEDRLETPDKTGRSDQHELAQLIKRLDTDEGSAPRNNIGERFEQFLGDLGLTKGALLLKNDGPQFKPVAVLGLSEKTVSRLRFTGEDKIVKSYLQKNKILHVKHDAFMHVELRSKFDLEDSSSIRSVYFVPLMPTRDTLAGFIMISATTGEVVQSPMVLEKLKEIKKTLTTII